MDPDQFRPPPVSPATDPAPLGSLPPEVDGETLEQLTGRVAAAAANASTLAHAFAASYAEFTALYFRMIARSLESIASSLDPEKDTPDE